MNNAKKQTLILATLSAVLFGLGLVIPFGAKNIAEARAHPYPSTHKMLQKITEGH